MSKIHDWERRYWRNKSGEREHNPQGLDVPEELLSLHENGRGETVGYRYADEDEPGEYAVEYNGEVPEEITLSGENFDDEEFETLHFDTRRTAREAASDLMRQLPPIDEEMLEDEEDGYSYDELQELAKTRGIPANQGGDDLREALRA